MVAIPQNTHDFDDGPDELLSPGEYLAEIAAIECKTSQRSGSDYLSVKFTVLHGESQGRSVWTNLNLWHPNSKAQYFAQLELKDICQAARLDRDTVHDTDQLVGKRMKINVVHRSSGDRTFVNIDKYSPDGTAAKKQAVHDDIPW